MKNRLKTKQNNRTGAICARWRFRLKTKNAEWKSIGLTVSTFFLLAKFNAFAIKSILYVGKSNQSFILLNRKKTKAVEEVQMRQGWGFLATFNDFQSVCKCFFCLFFYNLFYNSSYLLSHLIAQFNQSGKIPDILIKTVKNIKSHVQKRR